MITWSLLERESGSTGDPDDPADDLERAFRECTGDQVRRVACIHLKTKILDVTFYRPNSEVYVAGCFTRGPPLRQELKYLFFCGSQILSRREWC